MFRIRFENKDSVTYSWRAILFHITGHVQRRILVFQTLHFHLRLFDIFNENLRKNLLKGGCLKEVQHFFLGLLTT